jgi:predicted glycosyltransferase
VICRAGYNTINELLLTDAKALVIPEHHPSGEQERRARLIPRDNIAVMAEEDLLSSPADHILSDLLGRETVPLLFRFDKYAIGSTIITELESWWRPGQP